MSVYFTEEYLVRRHSKGTNSKGKYIKGPIVELIIDAHWQPLSGQDLLNLTELQRKRTSLTVWSEDMLLGLDELNEIPADIIVIDGLDYELQNVRYYKETELCPYYEAIAIGINQ